MTPTPIPDRSVSSSGSIHTGGLIALAIGTLFISWTPIWVRFTDVGPVTSAAWRMLLAVPALMLWMRLMAPPPGGKPTTRSMPFAVIVALVLAGFAFATDVASFHFALKATSIANATFIGNISMIQAVIGGALFFREYPDRNVWAGLLLSLVGCWVMAGMVLPTEFNRGDLLALLAATAYCIYLLAIKRARLSIDGPTATMWSAGVSAVMLVVAALVLEPQFLPQSLIGWAMVLALGFGSHALGQGLTSVAIGRVSVGVAAVVLLIQPPLSALLAWAVLGETMSSLQMLGGVIILAALAIARPR